MEEILTEAAAMVDSIDLPEDYRAIAFSKVIDVLAKEPSGVSERSSTTEKVSQPTSDWMERLERGTNKTAEELEELFFAGEDGEPLLGVDLGRLGTNTAQCSRKIILLLVGVRQVGGIETTTASEILRDHCKDLNAYDQSNFGKTLSGLKPWFNFTGSGSSKIIRLKPSGRKAFQQLVESLLGDDDN